MHFAVTSCWDQYVLLPPSIKRLAEKNYQWLKQNPKHPSIHFKKIRFKKIRQQLYSVRVGEHYRALFSAPFNACNHMFNDDTYPGNNRIKGLL